MREFTLIIMIAIITFLLRAFPFLVFSNRNEMNPVLLRMQKDLPIAVMILLVIYCIKNISFASPSNWLPQILSVCLVSIIHIKQKNVLLSILSGTFFYMFCVQFLFK